MEALEFGCKNCRLKIEIRFGTAGWGDFTEEDFFDLSDDIPLLDNCCELENKDEIRKLVESGKVHLKEDCSDKYGFAAYNCPQCGDFGDRFMFKLISESGDILYTSSDICERCGTKLIFEHDCFSYDQDKEHECPVCGHGMKNIGFWED